VTAAAFSRVAGFGVERGEWRTVDFGESSDGCRFRIVRGGEPFCDVELRVVGEHNARNALAAAAAAHEQGLTPAEIARGLASFDGVRRRLEQRGVEDSVTVLDDFAHHPTAIEATLQAVRRRWPRARIWAVLEPRSWSLRRNVFQQRLVEAFAAADEIVIAPVFSAEAIPDDERLDAQQLADDLRQRGASARHLGDVQAIVSVLNESVATGDVVVVMSNGSFDGLHERLLEALRARAQAVTRQPKR
jgi:UDP-N-acetylmuramate: L-alanyl-gamma-D-glutamyl-meso-diaminopimelate ligase